MYDKENRVVGCKRGLAEMSHRHLGDLGLEKSLVYPTETLLREENCTRVLTKTYVSRPFLLRLGILRESSRL